MNRQLEKRQRAFMLVIVGLLFSNLYTEFHNSSIEYGLNASSEESTYIAPEKVDLGCSVLWGSFNLGAKNNLSRGGFFGWGDPTGEKISQAETYGNAGLTPPVDLTQEHQELDIVHVTLGDKWHTPTSAQMLELINKCTWTHKNNYMGVEGLDGYEVRGKGTYANNYIFIPHYGCRAGVDAQGNPAYTSNTNESYYWSSELTDNPWGYGIYVKLQVGTSKAEKGMTFYGMFIRPVYGDGSGSVTPEPPVTEDHSLEIAKTTSDGQIVPAEGVDLGLSVNWASWNVGATETTTQSGVTIGQVGQLGGFYSWGETKTKTSYSLANYLYKDSPLPETILTADHDAAAQNWGDGWRMPTEDEWDELVVNCTVKWETVNYVQGYRYTSKKNGHSIFIPAGGVNNGSLLFTDYGYYWSSTKHPTDKQRATCMLFSNGHFNDPSTPYERFCGMLIRPVKNNSNTETTTESLSVVATVSPLSPTTARAKLTFVGNVTGAVSYELYYGEDQNLDQSVTGNFTMTQTAYATSEDKVLTNLKANQSYSFKLVARYAGGDDVSTTGTFNTPAKELKIEGVGATNITAKGASIQMSLVGNALEPVLYEITYSKNQDMSGALKAEGNVQLSYTSSQTFSVGIDQLEEETTYYFTVSVKYVDTEAVSMSGTFKTPEKIVFVVPDKVDLGCSVLWGTFNLGAKDVTGRGGFFGWGDPTGEKISQSETYGNSGLTPPVDLTKEHQELDIVHVTLEDKWHTPTSAQMLELINKCTWTHKTNYMGVDGLDGYEVRGKGAYANNYIFIPHYGCRAGVDAQGNPAYSSNTNESYYWSSELTDNPWGYGVYVKLQVGTSKAEKEMTFYGMFIRPVYGDGSGSVTPEPPVTEDHSLEIAKTTSDGQIVPAEGVDLGLSVNWASWNVGATETTTQSGVTIGQVGQLGGFYSWGETKTKTSYSLANYLYKDSPLPETILTAEHDAAQVNWGNSWRMPTEDEWDELVVNCTVKWETVNYVQGYRYTSKKNGRSIFLPAGGVNNGSLLYSDYGYYWSSTKHPTDKQRATCMLFNNGHFNDPSTPYERFCGMLIRPVKNNSNTVAKPRFTWEGDKLAISTDTEDANIYYSVKKYDTAPSGDGTLSSPYNVAGALQYISTLEADSPSPDYIYIKGVISSIVEDISLVYGNASFYLTDNGKDDGNRILGWRVNDIGGQHFTSEDVFKVGDEVIIYGQVTNYKGSSPRTVQGAYIYAITTPEINTLYEEPISVGVNVIVRAKAMKQGMSDSEMALISIGSEPYAVLSENHTVLTFYYDNLKEARGGMSVGTLAWNSSREDITTVVFDTTFSKCTTLSSTAKWFYGCSNLKLIRDIENLNTSNVTNMRSMFYGCSSLTNLDVSNFNTTDVINMYCMFYNCSSLTTLDVSNFNTSNVTNMRSMFGACSSLTNLDLSSFTTAKVKNMQYMFRQNPNLKTIIVGSGWSTTSIEQGDSLFYRCDNLVGGAGTTYDANHVDYSYAHIDRGSTNPGYLTLIDYSDWQVLKQLYNELNGEKWKRRWNTAEAPSSLDDYPGVTIKGGRVVEIDLPNNNIEGGFPCKLLSLPYLKKLNISDNSFYGDIGAAMNQFVQQNTSLSFNIQELSITNNKFTGNIGVFASPLSQLNHLDASNNCIEDVIPMISPNVTNLNLSRQETNRVVDVTLSDTTKSWITQVPTVLTYNHKQQSYGAITDANIYCSMKDGEWGFFVLGKVPSFPERNEYFGESGDTLRVVVLDDISAMQGGSFFIKLNFDNGDSNFDGHVNILDLQTTINYMFQDYDYLFNYTAVNLWKDEVINVQDIICLVNLLLMNPDNTGQNVSSRRTGTLDNAKVYVQDGQLILDTNMPVAAFDISVSGDNNMNVDRTLELSSMTIIMKAQYDGIHIIGYSLDGACIPAGISVIGTFGKTASVSKAMLSDKEAHAICVSYDGNIAGINTIEFTNHNNMNIYDLQGRKVNSITNKGIYIENGHKIVK